MPSKSRILQGSLNLYVVLFIWKAANSKRECSILWFILWMSATADAGPCWRQGPTSQSWSPCGWIQNTWTIALLFSRVCIGRKLRLKAVLELGAGTPRWNESISHSILNTMLYGHPNISFWHFLLPIICEPCQAFSKNVACRTIVQERNRRNLLENDNTNDI